MCMSNSLYCNIALNCSAAEYSFETNFKHCYVHKGCSSVWNVCCRIRLTSVGRRFPVVMRCREWGLVIKLSFSSMTTAWCHCLLTRTILEPFHIHQGLIFAIVQFSNVQFTLCNACFADEYTLVTAAGRRLLRSADSQTCSVKRYAMSSVTAVLPALGQHCGTVCLNSFGNRTSPSDDSSDRWKRLCLVSLAMAPCVWTLGADQKSFYYLLTIAVKSMDTSSLWSSKSFSAPPSTRPRNWQKMGILQWWPATLLVWAAGSLDGLLDNPKLNKNDCSPGEMTINRAW